MTYSIYELAYHFYKMASRSELIMWHGSPFRGIDDNFNNWNSPRQPAAFFTSNRAVAEHFSKLELSSPLLQMANDPLGESKKLPTIYLVKIFPGKFFDMRTSEDLKLYQEIRLGAKEKSKGTDLEEDFSWSFPKINSEGFISTTTGLPPYPMARVLKDYLISLGYDGIWVDEGGSGISLGIFNPQGKVQILERL